MNTSADRSVLTNSSIGSIAETLSAMTQIERAGLYVGLIRFLGIMWADIMRAIAIAENNDDMEALMQTSMTVKGKSSSQNPINEQQEALLEEVVLMQALAKTTAVTFFGSRMSMLQAHFESMEVKQAGQIARRLQAKLRRWRGEWTMGLKSVSRDRVERFCAVLAAYEIEDDDSEALGDDAKWADKQWDYLEQRLTIDAVQLQAGADCDVVDSDTLPNTQMDQAATEGGLRVQRRPGGPWGPAPWRKRS